MRGCSLLLVCLGLACSRASDDKPSPTSNSPAPARSQAGSGSGPAGVRGQQIAPPFDLKSPPADAIKTASGLIIKLITTKADGAQPKRNDTVMVNYTGWRQATGETFFTNQGRGQPMPLNLAQAAPGFAEALQQLHVGDKAVLWMPPEIGYKTPPTGDRKPETLVYQVEVVDLQPAPAIPDDVGAPPASAKALKSGTKTVVVRPGTGKDTIRSFDTVSYNFTAWDKDGRMVDTTESHKRPRTAQPYKLPDGMAEMLTSMTVGERARFWVDAEKIASAGVKPPGGIEHGLLCYEIDVGQVTKPAHEPPPTPPDVAKPPGDAKKTAKGVFYKLLGHTGDKDPRHPTDADTVKVHYTGWTTDGKMFDSSYLGNDPATFGLRGVIAGWTDGIPTMVVGDRTRFWIPVDLAYKGAPGKPAGMLVFDVELVEIVTPGTAH